MKNLIVIVIFVIVLIGGVGFVKWSEGAARPETSQTEQADPTPTPFQDTLEPGEVQGLS